MGKVPVETLFFRKKAGYNECETLCSIRSSENTEMLTFFHPLLAMIASNTDRELEVVNHSNSIPKLAARMEESVPQGLRAFAVLPSHWRNLRTTNQL